MKVQIVPTLLTHSLEEFKEKLELIAPHFNLVQIDCMDGRFVANKTFFEVDKVKSLKSKVDYELHLMVKNPLAVVKKWERYKKVKKVIFHYEAMKNDEAVFDLIKYIQKKKIQAGLAIKPLTPVNKIIKFLPVLDLVFLLGVEPGWGGQTLQSEVLNKAKLVRLKYPKLDIEIDGGVNLENIPRIIHSGVNIISAGTLIFQAEDIKATIKQIRDLIKN
jgi:ribulose-phosphate 3-epimerase